MSSVFFDPDLDGTTALSNINIAAFTWDAIYTRRSYFQSIFDRWKVVVDFPWW